MENIGLIPKMYCQIYSQDLFHIANFLNFFGGHVLCQHLVMSIPDFRDGSVQNAGYLYFTAY